MSLKYMTKLLFPVGRLWEEPGDSPLRTAVAQTIMLVEAHPKVLRWIDEELDKHGKDKKVMRVLDKRWLRERNQRRLALTLGKQEPLRAEDLHLMGGRKRTPAVMVLFAMCWQALTGGFKSQAAMLLLKESATIRVVSHQLGINVPSASTLWELISAVSPETLARIAELQVSWLGQDDSKGFEKIYGDSTAVAANSAWPVESDLLFKVPQRIVRLLDKDQTLWRKGGNAHRQARSLAKKLREMKQLVTRLDLLPKGRKNSKAQLKDHYHQLLKLARRMKSTLTSLLRWWANALKQLDELPSKHLARNNRLRQAQQDLDLLDKLIDQTHQRVIQQAKVAAADKVLSVSDSDASLIVKGNREATFGYKPQLARDSRGYVVALLVPRGNASDSAMMIPLVEKSCSNTRVVPKVASFDDGYTSFANYQFLLDMRVQVPSFSGSKARKVIPEQDYNSIKFLRARMERSRVESTMHQVKSAVNFGRLSRRGLQAVTSELLAKIITMNLLIRARLPALAA